MDVYKPESYPWGISYVIEDMDSLENEEENEIIERERERNIEEEDKDIIYLQEDESIWC